MIPESDKGDTFQWLQRHRDHDVAKRKSVHKGWRQSCAAAIVRALLQLALNNERGTRRETDDSRCSIQAVRMNDAAHLVSLFLPERCCSSCFDVLPFALVIVLCRVKRQRCDAVPDTNQVHRAYE